MAMFGAITDVLGIKVGHYTDKRAVTGGSSCRSQWRQRLRPGCCYRGYEVFGGAGIWL